MRQSKVFSFALCVALAMCVVHARDLSNTNHSNDGAAVRNDFPNVFRPLVAVFKKIFGKRPREIIEYRADVTDLILSRSEINAGCQSNQGDCLSDTKIGIYVEVNNPANDVLTYVYKVSGGKIIGEGDKAIWDLAGEKPGAYRITARVDDGCGVCGQTRTKTVTVVE